MTELYHVSDRENNFPLVVPDEEVNDYQYCSKCGARK